MVKIKRVYEPYKSDDGYRILVDRLWPRGIKKTNLVMDEWVKELAPSTELRKWFGHQVEHWKEFKEKYLKELKHKDHALKLLELAKRSKKSTLTLLYGARDEEHNHAFILQSYIEHLTKTHFKE